MDGDAEHKFYRYGGMWKNKHEAVSAKKPKGVGKKKASRTQEEQLSGENDNHAAGDVPEAVNEIATND